MATIRIGTSGWDYVDWVGPFYQSKSKPKLPFFSKVFDTAEINSTFYAVPRERTVMGWALNTPVRFSFAVKMNQEVTHSKVLDVGKGVEKDVEAFCERMSPLKKYKKLAAILIQLPPRLRFNEERLSSFFDALPSDFRFAIEFRHRSWLRDETFSLLEKHEVAYTIVDEPRLPPDVVITSPLAYIRWHGRGTRTWYNYLYSGDELQSWLPKVKQAAENAEEVYGYFNNHYHGFAPQNALTVLKMLGMASEKQLEALEAIKGTRLEEAIAAKAPSRTMSLADYMEGAEPSTVEELLGKFMDERRMARARSIADEEVRVESAGGDRVVAKVREYQILIDLENNVILHDCPDWANVLPQKRFCKHVGKLMLHLPADQALGILSRIEANKSKIQFRPYTGGLKK